MQSFEHICDRPIPLSPMTLDNYSQSIVLILTKNMSTIVVTDFQIGNAYSSIAFLYQHEIKRIRSCIRAQHAIVNVYLHSPINCMIYPNWWVQTTHVTSIHEWHECATWAIYQEWQTTLRIYRCCRLNFHWNHLIYTVLVQTYPKHCVILRKVK